jgi:hypothetical protein
MPTYKVGTDIYDIPDDKNTAFLDAMKKQGKTATPETTKSTSTKTVAYQIGNDVYDIPADKTKEFESAKPNAIRQWLNTPPENQEQTMSMGQGNEQIKTKPLTPEAMQSVKQSLKQKIDKDLAVNTLSPGYDALYSDEEKIQRREARSRYDIDYNEVKNQTRDLFDKSTTISRWANSFNKALFDLAINTAVTGTRILTGNKYKLDTLVVDAISAGMGEAQQGGADEKGFIENVKEGRIDRAADNAMRSFIQSSPVTAAYIFNPIAGGSLAMTSGMGGQTRALETSGMPEQAKFYNSLMYGTLEFATEMLGNKLSIDRWMKLAKTLPQDQFKKQFINQFKVNLAKKFTKEGVISMAGEGGEEFVNSVGQDFTDYFTGKEVNWDNLFPKAIESFAMGAASSAPQSAVMGTIAGREQAKINNIQKKIDGYFNLKTADLTNQPDKIAKVEIANKINTGINTVKGGDLDTGLTELVEAHKAVEEALQANPNDTELQQMGLYTSQAIDTVLKIEQGKPPTKYEATPEETPTTPQATALEVELTDEEQAVVKQVETLLREGKQISPELESQLQAILPKMTTDTTQEVIAPQNADMEAEPQAKETAVAEQPTIQPAEADTQAETEKEIAGGSKTYPIREGLLNGDKIWLVRQPNTKFNSIHRTKEDAIEQSNRNEQNDKNAEDSHKRILKEKQEKENTNGFADSFDKMKRGRIIKILKTKLRYEGEVYTRMDLVDKILSEGGSVKVVGDKPYLNKSNSIGFLDADTLSKTAMDYALFRTGQFTDTKQTTDNKQENNEPTIIGSKLGEGGNIINTYSDGHTETISKNSKQQSPTPQTPVTPPNLNAPAVKPVETATETKVKRTPKPKAVKPTPDIIERTYIEKPSSEHTLADELNNLELNRERYKQRLKQGGSGDLFEQAKRDAKATGFKITAIKKRIENEGENALMYPKKSPKVVAPDKTIDPAKLTAELKAINGKIFTQDGKKRSKISPQDQARYDELIAQRDEYNNQADAERKQRYADNKDKSLQELKSRGLKIGDTINYRGINGDETAKIVLSDDGRIARDVGGNDITVLGLPDTINKTSTARIEYNPSWSDTHKRAEGTRYKEIRADVEEYAKSIGVNIRWSDEGWDISGTEQQISDMQEYIKKDRANKNAGFYKSGETVPEWQTLTKERQKLVRQYDKATGEQARVLGEKIREMQKRIDELKYPTAKDKQSLATQSDTKAVVDQFKQVRRAAKVFGLTVKIEPLPGSIKAIYRRSDHSVVYNSKLIGTINPMETFGHEFTHWLNDDRQELYKQLRKWVNPTRTQINAVKKKYHDYAMTRPESERATIELNDEQAIEEIIADKVGADGFADGKFWETLKKSNPSVFDKVMQAINEWVASIKDKLGIEEYDKFKAVLPKVIREAIGTADANAIKIDEVERYSLLQDKNLVTIHNINAEELQKSIEMGGFPMPSLAVTDISKNSFNEFGAISLVGSEDVLSASRKNPVYVADAWTPTYPTINHILNKNEWNKLDALAKDINKNKILNSFNETDAHSLEQTINRFGYERGIEISLGDESNADKKKTAKRLAIKHNIKTTPMIRSGFTKNGNPKHIPYTNDNLVKEMQRQKNWNNSVSSVNELIGKLTPKLTNIKAVKKNRNRIVSKAEQGKILEGVYGKLQTLIEYAKDHRKVFNWMEEHQVIEDLYDIATRGVGFVKTEYSADTDFTLFREVLTDLRNTPSDYFEGKPERTVKLDEFKAAVVPNDTDSKLTKTIKDNGLKVYKYDKTNADDRYEQTKKASEELGIRYSLAEQSTPEAELSANIGTFDPNNADIRYSLSPNNTAGIEYINNLLAQIQRSREQKSDDTAVTVHTKRIQHELIQDDERNNITHSVKHNADQARMVAELLEDMPLVRQILRGEKSLEDVNPELLEGSFVTGVGNWLKNNADSPIADDLVEELWNSKLNDAITESAQNVQAMSQSALLSPQKLLQGLVKNVKKRITNNKGRVKAVATTIKTDAQTEIKKVIKTITPETKAKDRQALLDYLKKQKEARQQAIPEMTGVKYSITKTIDNLISEIEDGKVDIEDIMLMPPKARHNFFKAYVSEQQATKVNAFFEEKLLLKHQYLGLKNWVERHGGLKERAKTNMLDRIAKNEKLYNPIDTEFYEDLAATRLGMTVNKMEAVTLYKLAQRVTLLKEQMDTNDTEANRNEYGIWTTIFWKYYHQLKEGALKKTAREYIQPHNWGNVIMDVMGTVKSGFSWGDQSQQFRQLVDIIKKDPVLWGQSWAKAAELTYKKLANINLTVPINDKVSISLDALDMIHAAIASHPLYDQMAKGKLAIHTIEESYPTEILEKLPVLGRLYEASQDTFSGVIHWVRAMEFAKLYHIAKNAGVDMTNVANLKALASQVNNLTGRGELANAGRFWNAMIFSIGLAHSRINSLTGNMLNKQMTRMWNEQDIDKPDKYFFKEKGKDWIRGLVAVGAATATVYLMVLAMGGDPDDFVEFDPRSSDFLKVRYKNTRIDAFTGGAASYIVLLTRSFLFVLNQLKLTDIDEIKNSTTGVTRRLNRKENNYVTTYLDILTTWGKGKMSPLPSTAMQVLQGENYEGRKPRVKMESLLYFTPLMIQNTYDASKDPESAGLLGAFPDFVGMGTNSYSAGSDWGSKLSGEPNETQEMTAFKQHLDKKGIKFEKVNRDQMAEFDRWIIRTRNTAAYIKLGNEDKQKLLTKKRKEIKSMYFRKYGYRG